MSRLYPVPDESVALRASAWHALPAACLGPGGVLVQFTYSPLPPAVRAACAAFGWSGRRVAWVPWNLPPAAVWVYTVNEASLTTEA